MSAQAGITLSLGGEAVDLSEVAWVMDASCGCIAGLTIAYSAFGGSEPHIVVTAAQAEAAFHETPQERDRARERGFTYRPMRRADIPKPWTDCSHEPRFGYEKPPKPEGYAWAAVYALGARPKFTHLVPVSAVEAAKARDYSALDVKPLCGGRGAFHWHDELYATSGKVECKRCIAAASKGADR